MSKVGRNELCPCGSGLKYKRCCIEREAELQRLREAARELLELPRWFPLLRPCSPELEAWAAETTELTREVLEEGIGRLPAHERERIARAHAEQSPEAWADLGDESDAEAVALIGALRAYVEEERTFDPDALDHVQECPNCGSDEAAGMAAVIEACDLWSVDEAAALEEAIASGTRPNEFVAARWTDAHERRLALLVARVRAQLPVADRPAVSALLTDACARFERDAAFRNAVAQRLLVDTLAPWSLLRLAA